MSKKLTKFTLGCNPSLIDHNVDHVFNLRAPPTFPPYLDTRPHQMPIWDQKNCGSCTGHGTGRGLGYNLFKYKLPVVKPSPLFLYYGGREREGTIQSDSGCQIRDVVLAAAQKGFCEEKLWPYVISKFKTQPSKAAYAEAASVHHHAISYKRLINPLIDFKTALVNNNLPIIGFSVYQSFFDTGNDGRMPMPRPGESIEGGHCVAVVGYNDPQQVFICANSWDVTWGDKGYFYMPYDFANNAGYLWEAWVIGRV